MPEKDKAVQKRGAVGTKRPRTPFLAIPFSRESASRKATPPGTADQPAPAHQREAGTSPCRSPEPRRGTRCQRR